MLKGSHPLFKGFLVAKASENIVTVWIMKDEPMFCLKLNAGWVNAVFKALCSQENIL